jgi:hypothetical protein
MATFALKALPSEMIAVQRITTPRIKMTIAAILSQCAPPNMVCGAAPPIHSAIEIEPTIATHKTAIDPRSSRFPPPLRVRVAIAM